MEPKASYRLVGQDGGVRQEIFERVDDAILNARWKLLMPSIRTMTTVRFREDCVHRELTLIIN